jgi:putative flippase GtrA
MQAFVKQISWFIAVGCAAALTHWLVAIGCVTEGAAPPLLANVVGWLVAFIVSFSGHYHLTFRHSGHAWHISARRFFAISALGFAINEASYAYLLRVTAIRYDLLLALILIAIAGLTFLLSRLWAFRRNDPT